LVGTSALVKAHIADVFRWLGDAPAHVPVDHNPLLFGREHRLGICAVQREQALVDIRHVLKWRGQLEVQTGLGDHFFDLSEGVNHTELALVNDKQHGTE